MATTVGKIQIKSNKTNENLHSKWHRDDLPLIFKNEHDKNCTKIMFQWALQWSKYNKPDEFGQQYDWIFKNFHCTECLAHTTHFNEQRSSGIRTTFYWSNFEDNNRHPSDWDNGIHMKTELHSHLPNLHPMLHNSNLGGWHKSLVGGQNRTFKWTLVGAWIYSFGVKFGS